MSHDPSEVHTSAKSDRDDLLVYKSVDLNQLKRTRLFGIPIDNVTRDEAIALILEKLERKTKFHHILLVDPLKLLHLRLRPTLHNITNQASMILPEGRGLCWATGHKRQPLKERIPMIALIMDVMRLATQNDFSVYLLGRYPEQLERIFFNFQRNFKGIRITGRQAAFFGTPKEALVKEAIRKSSPHIILLALPFPKQELWIKQNKKHLGNTIIIGVDNSFALLSGKQPTHLQWIGEKGIQWFWQTIIRPWRISDMIFIFIFFTYGILSSLGFRKRKSKKVGVK